jgi:hypothetical protein
MRNALSDKLEQGRERQGHYASDTGDRFGAFEIMGPCGMKLIMLSSGEYLPTHNEWEHVSVRAKGRCPNWQEMCFVKELFWGDEECVVQYHPAKTDYINNHPLVLHLWKPPEKVPMPPRWMV